MGILDGQVALITGGARGQGRAHALALAAEGADVVLVDSAKDNATTSYAMATLDDLEHTAQLVEATGRRCRWHQADVRDLAALQEIADATVAEWGRIDILIANAGILSLAPVATMSAEMWAEMIAINLTGVFHAMRAVIPHMMTARYGRIVATSSVAGRMGSQNLAHYSAAKWGVLGLVKSAALETLGHGITVNAVTPPMVNTAMVMTDEMRALFLPDVPEPTDEQIREAYAIAPMSAPWVEPSDISRSVLFLVSPDSQYMTGETIGPTLGFAAQHGA
jgi:SDR family mycofactocin-dependent oxidoreductase